MTHQRYYRLPYVINDLTFCITHAQLETCNCALNLILCWTNPACFANKHAWIASFFLCSLYSVHSLFPTGIIIRICRKCTNTKSIIYIVFKRPLDNTSKHHDVVFISRHYFQRLLHFIPVNVTFKFHIILRQHQKKYEVQF